ncbi:MAG TPA: AAA family ATPase [Mycobacteriales bacterium]|nr:AAA family ATPase [Mycobacteriales bacterium]
MPETAVDPEIQSERDYQSAARAALRRMHSDVVNTETQLFAAGGFDPTILNQMVTGAREQRAKALVDLPDVPLFFGRLDYDPGTVFAQSNEVDRVYIGRRHVEDGGTPLVIDWRAPISGAFYRATRADRQGVLIRRRYGFSEAAELTAYEDEPLTGAGETATGTLLAAEIDRPRSGPMRDIVATIQPEQDELVRAPLHTTLCVQGAPGTGKTAVGLHRIAYLLYAERDRLGRNGVAVVGPNRSFLSYIRHVLPTLGEVSVVQTTFEQLVGRVPASTETSAVARIKGDARMAAVLHRALWRHVDRPTEGLMYIEGAFRYRIADYEVREIIASLRGATRYVPGRVAAAQRLAHAVLVQMERQAKSPDDRTQNAVARSRPVKQVLDAVWPKLTPEQVLFRLFSDAEFLAEAGEKHLSADERALLLWEKPFRSWKSAKWSAADCALLDELADLIERGPSLDHIVVDEAQDLSPMQARALARRGANGSFTLLGDIAQGTTPWAVDDWQTLLHHFDKPDAQVEVLDRGYRVPAQIVDYASRLLADIAPGIGAPTSARTAQGSLQVTETPDLFDVLGPASREALAGQGSVGLIAADADVSGIHDRLLADGLDVALLGGDEDALEAARLVCVPATLAKGLEFETVIVVEPTRIVEAEPRGLHRLYVVLTRAVSALHIIHTEPLPAPLRT